MLHDLLTFFARTYADVFGLTEGPPLHDPLAVAAVLDGWAGHEGGGGIVFDDRGGERWVVDVVTEGLHSEVEEERGQVGRTKVRAVAGGSAAGGGIRIPRGVDVERFWEVMEGCVARAEMDLDGRTDGDGKVR